MGFFSFNLKRLFTRSNNVISNAFVNADAISVTDERISREILKYQSDETKIDSFRRKHASAILALKKKTENSDVRNPLESKEILKDDVKTYAKILKRELLDIQKITKLANKITEDEYLSILYDIRKPLIILEHYKKTLNKNLKSIIIHDEFERKQIIMQINKLIDDLDETYERAMKRIIDECSQLNNFKLNAADDENIANTMEQRAIVKKQLVQVHLDLLRQIKKTEYFFTSLKAKGAITKEQADSTIASIIKFGETFNKLIITYVRREDRSSSPNPTRIELSEAIIRDAQLLLKRKEEELIKIQEELDSLKIPYNKVNSKENKEEKKIYTELNAIASSIKKEDEKFIRENNAENRLTVNTLARDEIKLENSKIHVDLPASKEVVSEKKGTVLDWFRKHGTKITFIYLLTATLEAALPVYAVAKHHDNPEKIIMYGTKEQVQRDIANFGSQVTEGKTAQELNAEAQKIVDEHTRVMVSQSTTFSNTVEFKYSRHFNNKEGPINKVEEIKTITNDYQKNIHGTLNNVRKKLNRVMEDSNLTVKEKDSIIENSARIQITDMSTITAFCSMEGFMIQPSDGQNNPILENNRAEYARDSIMQAVHDSIKNEFPQAVLITPVSKVKIVIGNPFKNSGNVGKTVDALNEFTKEVYKEMKTDSTLNAQYNQFFANFQGGKYASYRDSIIVNASVLKSIKSSNVNLMTPAQKNELTKFDLAIILFKSINRAKYEQFDADCLAEQRVVIVNTDIRTDIKVMGSGEAPIVIFTPVPGDTPVRPVDIRAEESRIYAERAVDKTSKGYAQRYNRRTGRFEAGDFRAGTGWRKVMNKQKQKTNK